jgi:hypothetical protein
VAFANNPSQGETGKEPWGRQLHLLNTLTMGQLTYLEGEKLQNPYYMAWGLEVMLSVLGPMISENEIVKDQYGAPIKAKSGEIKTQKVRGINTKTYKIYTATLSEARNLISASLQPTVHNRNALLNRAYALLRALYQELIQKASDFNLDFRKREDPNEAYKG